MRNIADFTSFFAFIVNPDLDQAFGENIPGEQEFIILFKGIQCFIQRFGERFYFSLFFTGKIVKVYVKRTKSFSDTGAKP